MKKNITLGLLLLTALFASCNNSSEKSATTQTETNAPATAPALAKDQWDQPQAAAGRELPNMQLTDASGNSHNLQSFKGKKVFVNLWASWCPPCKAEMPSIEQLYKSVDPEKAAFIMLAVDDKFETSLNYIKSARLDLPVYFAQGTLPKIFETEGIPATFFFDENGMLVQQIIGSRDYNTDEFRAMLQ